MKKLLIIIFMLVLNYSVINSAQLILKQNQQNVRIYNTKEDINGIKAIIKGKVVAFGVKQVGKNDLRQIEQEKTKITVRLYNKNNLQKGNYLYVINKRNLIIAKIKIITIFKSHSFGDLLIGYGNFKRVQRDNRVVQKISDIYSGNAYLYKARGDYLRDNGEISKAIIQYENAIQIDSKNPEAHTALGYIYLNKNILSYAKKEFDTAYNSYSRIYDNEDKFLLLFGLIKTRYKLAYQTNIPLNNDLKMKYIDEGIKFSLIANKIYSNSEKLNYYLGYFYYDRQNPDDVKVKEIMQKVIEINPKNANAYTILAKLYYKHENYEKALNYAEKALQIEPSNQNALNIYSKLKKIKK